MHNLDDQGAEGVLRSSDRLRTGLEDSVRVGAGGESLLQEESMGEGGWAAGVGVARGVVSPSG